MHLLEPAAYARVAPLVPSHRDAGHMAFVWSVLQGRQPGQAWVDDPEQPRSALVCNFCEFWFVLGEPNADLVAAAVPRALERLPKYHRTALWCTDPAWEPVLRPMFRRVSRRKEFHFVPEAATATEPALPRRLRLAPLDAEIVSRFMEPRLDPWVVDVAWGGADQMAAKSFGWAVMHDDWPVAFCAACAIGGPEGEVEAEIEICTDPAYRRQGLATVAALAFIASCRERGLIPAWSCAATNEPSARLARSLGFVEFREITGFELGRGSS